MTVDEIKEILYNQAIDGEFTNPNKVIKLLSKLTTEQKEIVIAAYWIGFNSKSYTDDME